MAKTLFEEALADMRQLRELAESNAKRAIIDDVTPKIKQLIESQLLGEADDDDLDEVEQILHDDIDEDSSVALGVSPPGSVGSTTEFLTGKADAQASGEQPEDEEPEETTSEAEECDEGYEVDESVVKSLATLSGVSRSMVEAKLELNVYRLVDRVNSILTMNESAKCSKGFIGQIVNTIRDVEDMYSYLKESEEFQRKGMLLNKLSNCHEILNGVKETTMRMKDLLKGSLREDKDVSLKISGLPDDVDLDNLSIQLVTDEEAGEEAGAPAELAPEAPEGAEGAEMAPEAPVAAPEEEGKGVDEMGPGSGVMSMDDDDDDLDEALDDEDLDVSDEDDEEDEDFDDEDVVEVVESMLRKEIARLKEEKEGPRHAAGTTDPKAKDFGGGEVEGEPFCDGEVTTEAEGCDDEEDVDEAAKCGDDDDLDEVEADEDSEEDELDELQNLRTREEMGEKVADQHVSMESRKRLSDASRKLEEARSLYAKALGTKKETSARKLFESAKSDYSKAEVAVKAAAVAAKKSINESPKNGGSKKQLADEKAVVESLRKQLAGTNLLNAKLIQVNKLLQLEGLTAKQKSVIIDRIDEAKDLRGVKLVYERLVQALTGKKVVKESAEPKQVIGSSSRTTKSSGVATPTVNEGVEVDRWARLAGIN